MPVPPQDVIDGARAAQARRHIPASVSIAQWALESGWGKSVSGKFNYGGITAKVKGAVFPFTPGTPLEPATLCWTHEDYKNQRVKCQRWFKDFPSMAAYFEAHAALIATAPIYAEAMAALPNRGLFIDRMAAHYATAPDYAAMLKRIIAGSGLAKYDIPTA